MSNQAKNTLLQVNLIEDGTIELACPDRERLIMAMVNQIVDEAERGEHATLDVFFAINVHMLTMEETGRFAKEYIENLKKTVEEYRRSMYEETNTNVN